MRWILATAALLGLAGQAAAQPAAPVEVMVVGTYHFGNPGRDINNPKVDDVLKPRRQAELDALARALAEFRPTKVMVERVSANLVDPKYPAFTPATLGQQRDERVQIGYRVASLLGHRTVYAIDEQGGPGEPDYFPFGKLTAWAQANGKKAELDGLMAKAAAEAARTEQLLSGSLPSALAQINRPDAIERDHGFYYQALALGDTEQQPGADLNAMWYLRNAKIFAKLQKAASPGDRVLVVYGLGHNYWLRHFADTVPGYRNVDPVPLLEQAARSLR